MILTGEGASLSSGRACLEGFARCLHGVACRTQPLQVVELVVVAACDVVALASDSVALWCVGVCLALVARASSHGCDAARPVWREARASVAGVPAQKNFRSARGVAPKKFRPVVARGWVVVGVGAAGTLEAPLSAPFAWRVTTPLPVRRQGCEGMR